MAAGAYYQDDWAIDDWYGEATDDTAEDLSRPGPPLDLIVLGVAGVAVLLLALGLWRLAHAGGGTVTAPPSAVQPVKDEVSPAAPIPAAPALPPAGADAFALPYLEYWVTQGPHGMSYGHYAIDIAAGKGEPITSPINGRVSRLFTDAIGNPTLVIENERYVVTLMHGMYSVEIGQELRLGDLVGTESNLGNTRDMSGRSCRNRDCGYHTHLNVYDKTARENVNPLDLLGS